MLDDQSNQSYQLDPVKGHHKKAASMSHNQVAKMNIEAIKEKRQNPFWAPSKNSDLFKVKEIIKEEKLKHRKKTNLAESTHKSNINTYTHKQNLIDGIPENAQQLAKNQDVHTDPSKGDPLKGTYLTEKPHDPSYSTKILKKITDDNKKLERIEEKANKDLNKEIRDKVKQIGGKESLSVKQFITRTRDIILMKYSTKVKQERAIRLNETYDNEVENIKDRITTLVQSKELFSKDFFSKFEVYVKTLLDQKDKEKNELANLIEHKSEVEGKIKQIENKISKNREKLDQYLEYKKFMLCIKEHKMPGTIIQDINVSSNLSEEKDIDGPGTFITNNSDKNKQKHSANKKIKESKSRESLNKHGISSIAGGSSIINESMSEADYNNSLLMDQNRIFEKPSDLIDELKKLETENVTCLGKLNEASNRMHFASNDLENYKKKEIDENENIERELKLKETILEGVKDRHHTLMQEKKFILHSPRKTSNKASEGSSVLTSSGRNSIYEAIWSLYDTCYQFYNRTNKEAIDEYNITHQAIMKSSNMPDFQIEMLKMIEKIFMMLNNNYKLLKENQSKSLNLIEKELDIQRKSKNNAALKDVIQDRIKILAEKIRIKNDKVQLHKRKVISKLRPIEKNKRANSMQLKEKNKSMDNFF